MLVSGACSNEEDVASYFRNQASEIIREAQQHTQITQLNQAHPFVKWEVVPMTESNTIKFTVPCDDKENMRLILRSVFDSLNEKGYNPINQIVGYLLTEDPTYITNYQNARSLICKLDRDELMQELVKCYLFEK